MTVSEYNSHSHEVFFMHENSIAIQGINSEQNKKIMERADHMRKGKMISLTGENDIKQKK